MKLPARSTNGGCSIVSICLVVQVSFDMETEKRTTDLFIGEFGFEEKGTELSRRNNTGIVSVEGSESLIEISFRVETFRQLLCEHGDKGGEIDAFILTGEVGIS